MEENKSLYWNPAIYKVVNQANSQKTYELVPVWFASAYYIWRTGEEGFKYCTKTMKASSFYIYFAGFY